MDSLPKNGFLCLSRHPGQSIVIDHPDGLIVVKFDRMNHDGAARLSIRAPRSVGVDRLEIRRSKEAGHAK